jgi:hypothetical protein
MEPLHHPPGVSFDPLLTPVRQPYHLEELGNAPVGHLRIHLIQAGEVAQVVDRGEAPVEPPLAAEDEADTMPDGLSLAGDVVTQDPRRARRRQQEGGQHLDRRCLARPIRPKQAEQLPRLNLERDVVDGHDLLRPPTQDPDGRLKHPAQIGDFDGTHGLTYG